MTLTTLPNRFGLHYFPDGEHYQEQDLHRWLPVLQRLGVSSLTLIAPLDRAIPEPFIRGLVNQQIRPILHFVAPVDQTLKLHELRPLIRAYADWGVREIVCFDRPNMRLSWRTSNWAQNRLVEHFLDHFIPFARLLIENGISPGFPPLEPGGEYWDTTFLRFALQSLERRRENQLLENLFLGAYGYHSSRPWNWGRGGPERWPGARPYLTPSAEQDQRGFYIFEWYAAISRAVLDRALPVILLRAGDLKSPLIDPADKKNLQGFIDIYRQLLARSSEKSDRQLHASLHTACLWLLSSEPGSQYAPAALFAPDGSPNPAGLALQQFGLESLRAAEKSPQGFENVLPQAFPISQYVLIPREQNQPLLNQFRKLADPRKVAFGSSFTDAALARQVIMFGQADQYSPHQVNLLSRAGCEVITCGDSGTELARILVTQ